MKIILRTYLRYDLGILLKRVNFLRMKKKFLKILPSYLSSEKYLTDSMKSVSFPAQMTT